MKNTIITTAVMVTSATIMAFTFSGGSDCSVMNAAGAPAGVCGDPAGGNVTCNTSGCHTGGPSPATQTGWITSNIPVTGYLPLTTYTITATATRAGHTKFGFEVSPQNTSGVFRGILATLNTQTKLQGTGSNYITHTTTGTSGSGSKTWNFKWTAPASGSGAVTLYGAFNITNANGTSTGDTIYKSTLTVNENTTGIAENELQEKISIYPNPSNGKFQLVIGSLPFDENCNLVIYNLQGEKIYQSAITNPKSDIDLSNYGNGIYFLKIYDENKVYAAKILKQY